jgi:cell division protein FtsB
MTREDYEEHERIARIEATLRRLEAKTQNVLREKEQRDQELQYLRAQVSALEEENADLLRRLLVRREETW